MKTLWFSNRSNNCFLLIGQKRTYSKCWANTRSSMATAPSQMTSISSSSRRSSTPTREPWNPQQSEKQLESLALTCFRIHWIRTQSSSFQMACKPLFSIFNSKLKKWIILWVLIRSIYFIPRKTQLVHYKDLIQPQWAPFITVINCKRPRVILFCIRTSFLRGEVQIWKCALVLHRDNKSLFSTNNKPKHCHLHPNFSKEKAMVSRLILIRSKGMLCRLRAWLISFRIKFNNRNKEEKTKPKNFSTGFPSKTNSIIHSKSKSTSLKCN